MNNLSDFFKWEASSLDTIDFKKVYVDMVTTPESRGDMINIIAGLALSEIVFWFLPNKKAETKLRIQRNGYFWVAIPREEWWERTRLSPKQADRAIEVLKANELIVSEVFHFKRVRTVHIRINESVFLSRLNALLFSPTGNIENSAYFPPEGICKFPERENAIYTENTNRDYKNTSSALVSHETSSDVLSSQSSGNDGQPETENLPHSKKNESYTETQPEPTSAKQKTPTPQVPPRPPSPKSPKKPAEKVEGSVTPGQMFQAFLDAAMCHKTDKQNADKLDDPTSFGSYTGYMKDLIKRGVTIDQMTRVGKMYHTYLSNLPRGTDTVVAWNVGYIKSGINVALGLLGKVTAAQVSEYVQIRCREDFYKANLFPFKGLEGMQTWITTPGGMRNSVPVDATKSSNETIQRAQTPARKLKKVAGMWVQMEDKIDGE